MIRPNFERIRSATPVIIAVVCFLVVGVTYSCTARADDPKPVVVWVAANALTAFAVGWFILPAVTIAGKQEALCSAMKGKYDPTAKDLCEGGDWVRIIPYLPIPKEK